MTASLPIPLHARAKEEAEPEPETLNQDPADTETLQKPPSKLVVYEQYLKVPHYLVYSRQSQQLRYFHLIHDEYQEHPLNASNPLVWLNDLQIGLGIWQGSFDDAEASWLRWCNQDGTWFLTDTEQENLAKLQAEQQAVQERLAKEQERLAKEQERVAKEQTQKQLLQAAQNLLASGMAMEQVTALLNLSAEQIRSLNDLQN